MILGQDDPLEEEMATHSSILAWRIPWTGEPGRLQSMGVTKSQTCLSYYTDSLVAVRRLLTAVASVAEEHWV